MSVLIVDTIINWSDKILARHHTGRLSNGRIKAHQQPPTNPTTNRPRLHQPHQRPNPRTPDNMTTQPNSSNPKSHAYAQGQKIQISARQSGALWVSTSCVSGIVPGASTRKDQTMRNKTFTVLLAAASVASGLAIWGSSPAFARSSNADLHCVVEVTAIQNGVFDTSPEVCFASQGEAVLHAESISGGHELGGNNGELNRSKRTAGNNTIGTHYTSTWYEGSSIRVVGTTCGGGVWRPTGTWDNNIESSKHYCGSSPTTFYSSADCRESGVPIRNDRNSLGSLNNRVSCVRYG